MSKSNEAKLSKETIEKIFFYIKKYWLYVGGAILLAGITTIASLYVLRLIGDAVDCIVKIGAVDFKGLIRVLEKLGLLIGVAAVSQWIMSICNNKVVYHVIKDIRRDAFKKIEILPLKYIDAHAYGEIVSKVIADVDQFADGLLMGFTQLFTGVITIVGIVVFMLQENGYITAVVVCLTPISMFIASFIAKKTNAMFKEQSQIRGEQTGFIDEMLENQKVVQAFGYEEESLSKFKKINDRLEKASLHATFFSSITNPATRFVNTLVYTGVGITGAIAVVNGSLTIGALTCFLNYANQYTKPFNEISGVITELQNALVCAKRIFDLIDEKAEMPDAPYARELNHLKGEVALRDVSFSYSPDKKFIEHLNVLVKPGQKIAIVGPTGCGKTTLINLLMRFYEVRSGEIKIDQYPMDKITRKSLRANFGMVLQETWLKSGTIRENLMMGKPEATEEEMIKAAKSAHVHNIIMRMPKGYDTMITDEAEGISQGEKQLLCIARVMLCMPPMLILDEATSSIDARTEIKIQKAFAAMMEGRTSFIIAHRLATIKNADSILVMKEGRIVEQGTHDELLNKKGFYFELYRSQFA